MQQYLPLAHVGYIYELMIQGGGAIQILKNIAYKNTAILLVMVNRANLSAQLSKCHSAKDK